MSKLPNYYAILGVGRHSDEDTIRKAYRLLAKRYHPDRNPNDPDAAERIRVINEAYRVLSDPELRSKYDEMLFQKARHSTQSASYVDPNATSHGTTSRFHQAQSDASSRTYGKAHQEPPPAQAPPKKSTGSHKRPDMDEDFGSPSSGGHKRDTDTDGHKRQTGPVTLYHFRNTTHEDVLGPIELENGVYIIEFLYSKAAEQKADLYLDFQEIEHDETVTLYGNGAAGRSSVIGKKTLRVLGGRYLIQLGFIWHPEAVTDWQVRLLKP